MSSDAIIPNDNGSGRPFDSGLDVLRIRNVVVQELEQVIRLFLLVANDALHKLLVYEQCLFTRGRVCADEGVSVGDGIAADDAAAGECVVGLLVARVNGLEPMQALLERGRQTTVRLCLVGEAGVSAGGWAV